MLLHCLSLWREDGNHGANTDSRRAFFSSDLEPVAVPQ